MFWGSKVPSQKVFLDVFGEITYEMNMKPENLLNMDDNLLGATCIVDDITYENEKTTSKGDFFELFFDKVFFR